MSTENDFVIAMNAVRQAWVAKMPEDGKNYLRDLPRDERFSLYEKLDNAIVEVRTYLIKQGNSRKEALEIAVQTVVHSFATEKTI